MTALPTVETNVPLPKNVRPSDETLEARKTFRGMNVGDSLFFADVKAAGNFASRVRNWAKPYGTRPTVRAVPGGWRVWKIAVVESPNVDG